MEIKKGQKWSREETILAFDLYCHMPFGKIGQTNNRIIELAKMLRRTPGSVALKMQNLAHYDPELRARNVTAMAHGSKLDAEIFDEFYENLEELTYQADSILQRITGKGIEQEIDLYDLEALPVGEDRERMRKERIGQNSFRRSVLTSYDNRCCITGLRMPVLLIASHIKPWAVSNEKNERTNPRNGLCLNPLHDRAFDQGLITIDESYKVIISSKLRNADMDESIRNWLMRYSNEEIYLPDKFKPGKLFIEYHNDVIFKP